MGDRRHPGRALDRCLPDLTGDGQTAVLAHPPKVERHEDDDRQGDERDVEGVEVEERRPGHFRTAEEQRSDLITDQGDVGDEARADGDGPEGELVPGEEIAGEVRAEDQEEHHDSEDPIHFPRRSMCSGEEHPEEVQHRHDDQ